MPIIRKTPEQKQYEKELKMKATLLRKIQRIETIVIDGKAIQITPPNYEQLEDQTRIDITYLTKHFGYYIQWRIFDI